MTLQLTKLGVHNISNPEEDEPNFLSAASGTVWAGNTLYSVGDDQASLARFTLEPDRVQDALRQKTDRDILGPGFAWRIIPGVLPLDMSQRAEQKPDFEALTMVTREHIQNLPDGEVRRTMSRRFPHGMILTAGSGGMSWGGKRRSIGVVYSLDHDGDIIGLPTQISLEELHEHLEAQINGEPNIEGICIYQNQVVLAHRGNSFDTAKNEPGENMLIWLSLEEFLRSLYTDFKIGKLELDGFAQYNKQLGSISTLHENRLHEVKLDFTDVDAVSRDPHGRLIIVAAAEGVLDGPFKGKIAGSAVGLIDKNGQLTQLEYIDDRTIKLEGIDAWYNPTLGSIDFLAAADADDPQAPAPLYAGRLL